MSVFLTVGKIGEAIGGAVGEAVGEAVARCPAKLVLVLGITVLAAACASDPVKDAASAGNAAAPATAGQVASNGDEMQCKYIKVTGTNLPQKFCKTKAMWEAMDKASKSVADEFMRETNQNATQLQHMDGAGDGNGGSSQRATFN